MADGKPVASILGVSLSPASMDRLEAVARIRNLSRAEAAGALLEAALKAANPKPAPIKRNNAGEFALYDLGRDGAEFNGALFVRQIGCGKKTLAGYLALGWIVPTAAADTYKLSAKGLEAVAWIGRARR